MSALKIVIFENDHSVANLLKILLNSMGYTNVKIFSDPSACPICTDPDYNCPRKTPCADILISDNRMPIMNGVELFKLQTQRNCKLITKNMALMSAGLTTKEKKHIESIGCHYIQKPFDVEKVTDWLKECEARSRQSK